MARVLFVPLACAALPLAACRSGNSPSAARDVELVKDAYFASWTKPSGTPWTSDKLKAVATTTPEFLSIDGMVPPPPAGPGPIIEGFEAYEALWSSPAGMNQFTTAELKETGTLRTWVGGDTAATVSTCRVMGTMVSGASVDLPANVTLVFRKSGGAWKVVHENMNVVK